MATWFSVGAGGALGAIARHALNHLIHQRLFTATFPYGVFAANVLGSVLIGMLTGLVAGGRVQVGPSARLFLVVGLFGGFTTFSSFSLDTLALVRDGHPAQAALNVIGQVGLGLAGVFAGYRLASG
ncbi:MAG: fluoride efflux transporter CrcB [Vicinamibacterales bacterium]